MLKQSVNDTISPVTVHTRKTADVIDLEDSVSPLILRNRNDRKMTVKVRTRSGIKRIDMKAVSIVEDIHESHFVKLNLSFYIEIQDHFALFHDIYRLVHDNLTVKLIA